jgi:hypothetical protein
MMATMPKVPSEKLLAAWKEEIRRNGEKSLQVSALLQAFGAKRRGGAVWERIESWCTLQRMYIDSIHDVTSIRDRVRLTDEPIVRIRNGKLVKNEEDLAARFKDEIAEAIGNLTVEERDHRPEGSRDKIDFLCRDRSGRAVAVELKRAEGEKRVVEQILRYLRLLKKVPEFAARNPRGIIVTGKGDLATRRALEEVDPGSQIEWYVYGVVDGRIEVKRVEIHVQQRPTMLVVEESTPRKNMPDDGASRKVLGAKAAKHGTRPSASRGSKQPCTAPPFQDCDSGQKKISSPSSSGRSRTSSSPRQTVES